MNKIKLIATVLLISAVWFGTTNATAGTVSSYATLRADKPVGTGMKAKTTTGSWSYITYRSGVGGAYKVDSKVFRQTGTGKEAISDQYSVQKGTECKIRYYSSYSPRIGNKIELCMGNSWTDDTVFYTWDFM